MNPDAPLPEIPEGEEVQLYLLDGAAFARQSDAALLEPAGMVQVPVPVQAPLQPANVLPLAACAIRVMAVSLKKLDDATPQSAAQLKPLGLLVT